MEDRRIFDRQLLASSEWSSYNTATNARLNFQITTQKTGGWSAKTNDGNQWLRVDFGSPMKMTGIDTQGRQDYNQWVTSYTVSYSLDNIHYENYQQNGQVKVGFSASRQFRQRLHSAFPGLHPLLPDILF